MTPRYRAWLIPLLGLLSLGATGRDVPLVEAVKAHDAAAVRALLQQSVDVNLAELDGTTALHWAVHGDDLDTVELMLRAGAEATATNRYGVTPLSLACENGNAAIIGRLLNAGADPNTTLADGETALMTAARAGRPDAVTVLLRYGAEVNAKERQRGQTALIWAASENNAAAADVLIHAGADIDWRSTGGFTPLLFATRAGHIETTRVLLEAGADVDDTLPDATSALGLAIINAHYELAVALLDAGADPNADGQGWTALHQVAYTRRPNIGLSDPGAVPTGMVGSLDLVSRLVEHGADPNARQTKERQLGLDDRNILNRVGATPFLLAAKNADAALMRALVANGADPLLTNEDETTPLMAAAGVGIWVVGESAGTNAEALEAVQLAFELGGDVKAVDDYGYTALHGAAHRGSVAIVRFLADEGATLDATLTKTSVRGSGGKEGWTALTIAEGVFYANTFKRSFETAALLRDLLEQRGLTTAP
jgi:ankyrin repeat protein